MEYDTSESEKQKLINLEEAGAVRIIKARASFFLQKHIEYHMEVVYNENTK